MRFLNTFFIFGILSICLGSSLLAEPFLDSTSTGRFSISRGGISSYLDAQSRTQNVNCGASYTIPQNGFFFSTTETTQTEFDRSFGVWHHCRSSGTSTKNWGTTGDIPVVGDYDGNSYSDYAVYRPSNQTWYISYVTAGVASGISDTIQFGLLGDTPYPIDADGDGIDNIAIFRRVKSSGGGKFIYRTTTGTAEEIPLGLLGDQPIFGVKSGIGRNLFSVYRPETGEWFNRAVDGTVSSFQFGLPGDIPMGAPILPAVSYTPILYRPKEAKWFLKEDSTVSSISFGELGSKPSSESLSQTGLTSTNSDVDGDFFSDLVLARKKPDNLVEMLSLRSSALSATFKNPVLPAGSFYVNTDFDGDLKSDFASVRTDNGSLSWYLHLSASQFPTPSILLLRYGLGGDQVVPADYDGDGRADLSVVRKIPSENGITNLLWIPLASGATAIAPYYWGLSNDILFTGDVDGDKRADSTVVRKVPQGLLWLSRSADGVALEPFLFGLQSDIPHLYDLNGDGLLEAVVEREIDGYKFYYSRDISKTDPAFQWGLSGDTTFSGFKRGLVKESLGVWRIISGQGYFFVRNDPLPPISIPFGVPGDVPLIEHVAKAPVATATPSPSASPSPTSSASVSGSVQRVSCNGTSNVENQESGFVWKPVSDSDGKLAVLFGSGRAGKIASVTFVESTATGDVVLETLKFAYNSNGNRPTYRAKKSGGSYPAGVIMVRQDGSGFKECIKVSNPGKRVG